MGSGRRGANGAIGGKPPLTHIRSRQEPPSRSLSRQTSSFRTRLRLPRRERRATPPRERPPSPWALEERPADESKMTAALPSPCTTPHHLRIGGPGRSSAHIPIRRIARLPRPAHRALASRRQRASFFAFAASPRSGHPSPSASGIRGVWSSARRPPTQARCPSEGRRDSGTHRPASRPRGRPRQLPKTRARRKRARALLSEGRRQSRRAARCSRPRSPLHGT
ncbi:unnamed protein product [Ixodes persulcatus]